MWSKTSVFDIDYTLIWNLFRFLLELVQYLGVECKDVYSRRQQVPAMLSSRANM